MRNLSLLLLTCTVALAFQTPTSHAQTDAKKDDPEKVLADALTNAKQKDNVELRVQAIMALADFGAKAAPALPDLLDALQTKNEDLRLNAAIALSILFLGPEMVRVHRGETSWAIEHPWVVAFAFGLLHGFGFASGLADLGLSRAEIPLALLLFNLGVECGQLFFVGVILLLIASFRVLQIRWARWAEWIPAYTVGSLGAYWTVQRTLLLFTQLR